MMSYPLRIATAALILAGAGFPAGAQETPMVPPDTVPQVPVGMDIVARTAQDTVARIVQDTAARAAQDTVPRDDERGVDAEIRIALFEILNDQWLPAVGRLEWLRDAPVSLTPAAAARALRGREDLLFLLAQGYYRLGMGEQFRATAGQLISTDGSGRYDLLLRSQLLLDAYRRGDRETARSHAQVLAAQQARPELQSLAWLVSGLAAYHVRDYDAATAAFQSAQAAGGVYGGYAEYMDALTALRGDTANTDIVLQRLRDVASRTSGAFADQVLLTAAQLAYEGERFDEAASLAGRIPQGSGVAPQAMLVRAWALYKAERIAEAGDAFARFGTQYPQLPEAEEGLIMSAQVLLQLGNTDDAGRLFRQVADSALAISSRLDSEALQAVSDAARAVVRARAVGVLYVSEPAHGKTVELADSAGVERGVVLTAFNGDTVEVPGPGAAELLSVSEVMNLLDALEGGGTNGETITAETSLHRRVFFMPASAGGDRAQLATRTHELYAADVALALARYGLLESLESHRIRLALMEQLYEVAADGRRWLDSLAAELRVTQDSLARLIARLDVAAVRVRQLLMSQVNATRLLADENEQALAAVRAELAGNLDAGEMEIVDLEARTVLYYRQMADMIAMGLDGAIERHPAFARRDSVRRNAENLAALVASTRDLVGDWEALVTQELERLRSLDPAREMAGSLAAAEAGRRAAEARLVDLVSAELRARADEMLAGLTRDIQAAEFGAATASFFKALETGETAGTPAPVRTGAARERGTTGTAAAGTSDAQER